MRKILSLAVNAENFFRFIGDLKPTDSNVKTYKNYISSLQKHPDKENLYQLLSKVPLATLLTSTDKSARKMVSLVRTFRDSLVITVKN
jgi:hypothetical protein